MEFNLAELNRYAGPIEAVATIASTLIVSWIAWMTYRFTKAQSQVTMIKHLNDMINDWDKVLLSDERNMKILNDIRAAIIDPRTDNILFFYLNYLHSTWRMSRKKLVDSMYAQVTIENGAELLSGVGQESVSRLLDCGFETAFKRDMLAAIERHRKKPPTSRRTALSAIAVSRRPSP